MPYALCLIPSALRLTPSAFYAFCLPYAFCLMPSAMSLPIGAHITQSAITGKIFTNKSNAVISILVVGGAVTSTILVNPFSGVLIPDKWVNIVITNLSTTEVAAYDIFLK